MAEGISVFAPCPWQSLPLPWAACWPYAENRFKWGVFVFGTLTTLLLQILSNLANDYGDAQQRAPTMKTGSGP
jgi:hypothetical protein